MSEARLLSKKMTFFRLYEEIPASEGFVDAGEHEQESASPSRVANPDCRAILDS